ncbi:HAMP domain-containing histidine kinase [Amycolatopsis nigrescens]|uniref:HAMP domain-containing histidine kinase n=1 Tax=Amycolatopsis nigrescens TaxID=381445 RepID=UPI0003756D43|nr:HAMP domain-containing histidine kinase [Amycolatopsis nigrescens]
MTLLAVLEATLLAVAIGGGVIALDGLREARFRLVEQIDPQLSTANELSTGLLNQETGVRGYMLTGRQDFLEPYERGKAQQQRAVAELRRLGATEGTVAGTDLDRVLRAADGWQGMTEVWTVAGGPLPGAEQVDNGKVLFDAVRSALDTQRVNLELARDEAKGNLYGAETYLTTMLVVIAALLAILYVLLYFGFRRTVARPLLHLAGEVRAVTDHDIHRQVEGGGPRELMELAADIEAMRRRIVAEVSELHDAHELLDTRTQELQRSNSDLEQFAYVASHDLQEPLRKVASFCQLLQRRYQGQLDERGEQYIEFAVDGAKRMQALINDLLSFSRVGRRSGEFRVVDADELAETAIGNLEQVIEESGATVTHDELPRVRGEVTLLTAVFQNLVNNALKFRGERVPEVHIGVRREDTEWKFSVTDNGIGIEPEYAERIFVIFQRLHAKSAYPGTGIGLALCRRIVEYHGGRIWLDSTDSGEPTRFCFTLPVSENENEEA